MKEHCKNHPNIEALSFCHSCKEYYCEYCLEEGKEYYYCKKESCEEAKNVEATAHDEVNKSKGTAHPKILINGEAVGFCDKCMDETNSISISKDLSLRKAVLRNERSPCEKCGSVIMDFTKPGSILSFIEGKSGSYRIIKTWDLDPAALYLHRDKFISRKIK